MERTPVPGQFRGGASRLQVEYESIEMDDGKHRTVGKLIVPWKADPPNCGGAVLAGGYAVDTSETSSFKNEVTFFKLWIGDRGGWNVKMYVSDHLWEITKENQIWVAEQISVSPLESMMGFGLEFKRCGLCGRGLTNDESRAFGIGPICRERL